MKIRDLTTVVLRLYSFYLFYHCLPLLYRIPLGWQYSSNRNDSLYRLVQTDQITMVVFYIVSGVLLLVFARRLAGWVTRDVKDNALETNGQELVRMSLGIVGIIFLVGGIRSLGYGLSSWYFLPDLANGPFSRPDISFEQKAGIVTSVISILAGLILFLGKTGLTDVLLSIRNAGQNGMSSVDGNRTEDS